MGGRCEGGVNTSLSCKSESSVRNLLLGGRDNAVAAGRFRLLVVLTSGREDFRSSFDLHDLQNQIVVLGALVKPVHAK